jgi:hypothetical protein
MRNIVNLAIIGLLAVVLFTSVAGTAAGEPQKNQILIPATCDDGQSYTFVINGMSKVGQIIGDENNIAIKSFTVDYFDSDGNLVGGDTLDQGNKEGLQGDLISCTGSTTTELQGLGSVTAFFEFTGFVTPRGA